MADDRIAVTGGNGRIGRAVIRELNAHGYETINVDIEPKYRTEARRERAGELADEYVTADLTDAGETYGALAHSTAVGVFHGGTIRRPTAHPGFVTYESNAMTTYHVLEAASGLGIDTVCLASSINVLGANFQDAPTEVAYLPVDEQHPLTPRDPYALGKQTMEVLADGFARRRESPRTLSSIRFPWVLRDEELEEMFAEPDRSLEGLENPPAFMAAVNEYTTRDVMFAYLHVEDAAAAVRHALEASFAGHEAFWAVAEDTTADAKTSDIVEAYYPDVEVRAAFGGHEGLIRIEKARGMLGWQPKRTWREL